MVITYLVLGFTCKWNNTFYVYWYDKVRCYVKISSDFFLLLLIHFDKRQVTLKNSVNEEANIPIISWVECNNLYLEMQHMWCMGECFAFFVQLSFQESCALLASLALISTLGKKSRGNSSCWALFRLGSISIQGSERVIEKLNHQIVTPKGLSSSTSHKT